MEQYSYVFVVTGQVEAPNEEHARTQVLMGVSTSARLVQAPGFTLALEVTAAPPKESVARNGRPPVLEH
jgi:hypothetical protein